MKTRIDDRFQKHFNGNLFCLSSVLFFHKLGKLFDTKFIMKSRQSIIFNKFYRIQILRNVKRVSRVSVSSKTDCRFLSEVIYQKIGHRISDITLYRVLLSPRIDHIPYISTLDALAQYCNYKDWNNFSLHVEQIIDRRKELGFISFNHKEPSLLSICLDMQLYTPVVAFFKSKDLSDLTEIEQFMIGEEVYYCLYKNKHSNKPFFDMLSGNPIIRKCFFEFLADQEFRIPDYEYGLRKYIDVAHIETDKIFAYALLCRNHFKEGDLAAFNRDFDFIDRSIKDILSLKDKIHMLPWSRMLMCQLLKNKITLNELMEKIEQQFMFNLQERKWLLYIIVDTLILLKKTDDIVPITQKYFKKLNVLRQLGKTSAEDLPAKILNIYEFNASNYLFMF